MAKSSTSGQGRPKGVPNKLTSKVREAFEEAFEILQQEESSAKLSVWARIYPTEFYKLASKLIPSDVNANIQASLTVVTGVPDEDDCSDLV